MSSFSADAKHRRGVEHLTALRAAMTTFLGEHPYDITVERTRFGQYAFRVRGLAPPPPQLGLLIGDCVHNLRSALDHLVHDLAVLNRPTDSAAESELTREDARSTAFPITRDPQWFARSAAKSLRLLRPVDQERIEHLQPYHSLDVSIWGLEKRLSNIPLLLHDLHLHDVLDKHRFVQPTWRSVRYDLDSTTEAYRERCSLPGYRGAETFGGGSTGTLKDGALVGRWTFEPPPPHLPPEMDLRRHFPVSLAFGRMYPNLDGVGVLDGMAQAVRFVLDLFRPALTAGAPPLALTEVADPVKYQRIEPDARAPEFYEREPSW